jgi:hypothetical protein
MPTVTVINLSTGQEAVYVGLDAPHAVVAAYALLERKDAQTNGYETRYGHLPRRTKHGFWFINDWCAREAQTSH